MISGMITDLVQDLMYHQWYAYHQLKSIAVTHKEYLS